MIADLVHGLVERYGLAAVFVGCLAEGETAAILGGFLAHQRLYAVWQVYAAVAAGAFLGDTACSSPAGTWPALRQCGR